MIHLIPLPLPPSGTNHGYQIIRMGKAHRLALTKDMRVWKDAVGLVLQVAQPAALPPRPWDIALVWVLPKVGRRSDLDGTLKYTLDVLARAWGFDDRYIDYITYERIAAAVQAPLLAVVLSEGGMLPCRSVIHTALRRVLPDGSTNGGTTEPVAMCITLDGSPSTCTQADALFRSEPSLGSSASHKHHAMSSSSTAFTDKAITQTTLGPKRSARRGKS